MDFHGRTAVVTAGAHGIGRSVCRLLASRGANVVIADLDSAAAEQVAIELRGGGAQALGLGCDVRSETDLERVRAASLAEFGPVQLLVNHAGRPSRGLLEQISIEEWHELFDLNVFAMVRVLHAFLPGLLAAGDGHIVFTTSSLALIAGNPHVQQVVPYVTSKAAVIGLAQATAAYLAPRGIGVTLFAPEYTATEFSGTGRQVGDQVPDPAVSVPYPPQTPEEAAGVLLDGLERGIFLAAATPEFAGLLRRQAELLLDPVAMSVEFNTHR